MCVLAKGHPETESGKQIVQQGVASTQKYHLVLCSQATFFLEKFQSKETKSAEQDAVEMNKTENRSAAVFIMVVTYR